jgi:hypothetical protein
MLQSYHRGPFLARTIRGQENGDYCQGVGKECNGGEGCQGRVVGRSTCDTALGGTGIVVVDRVEAFRVIELLWTGSERTCLKYIYEIVLYIVSIYFMFHIDSSSLLFTYREEVKRSMYRLINRLIEVGPGFLSMQDGGAYHLSPYPGAPLLSGIGLWFIGLHPTKNLRTKGMGCSKSAKKKNIFRW